MTLVSKPSVKQKLQANILKKEVALEEADTLKNVIRTYH